MSGDGAKKLADVVPVAALPSPAAPIGGHSMDAATIPGWRRAAVAGAYMVLAVALVYFNKVGFISY